MSESGTAIQIYSFVISCARPFWEMLCHDHQSKYLKNLQTHRPRIIWGIRSRFATTSKAFEYITNAPGDVCFWNHHVRGNRQGVATQ